MEHAGSFVTAVHVHVLCAWVRAYTYTRDLDTLGLVMINRCDAETGLLKEPDRNWIAYCRTACGWLVG